MCDLSPILWLYGYVPIRKGWNRRNDPVIRVYTWQIGNSPAPDRHPVTGSRGGHALPITQPFDHGEGMGQICKMMPYRFERVLRT